LNTQKDTFYCDSGQTQEWVAQRGYGVSILGNICNLTGQSPGQPALSDPA